MTQETEFSALCHCGWCDFLLSLAGQSCMLKHVNNKLQGSTAGDETWRWKKPLPFAASLTKIIALLRLLWF